MTTLEKLFAQIFDRKDRIIEQTQQQADSYTQQLASRLVIDGITPPPWLLSPNSNSRSSDPNELKKEKIISKLLLRRPRDPTQYSTGGHSMKYRAFVAGGNVIKRLSTEICVENHAPNKATSSSNEPVLTHECENNDMAGGLDHVPEVDESAKSPQNETEAIITSIDAAPAFSPASFQRSKVRQRARELRTNGKTTAKSCLSNEDRTCISSSGDLQSKKNFHQVTQDKCPSDMSKWDNISGSASVAEEGNGEKGNDRTSHSHRHSKSSSSYEVLCLENEHNKIGPSSDKEELDGGIMAEPIGDLLQQAICSNEGVLNATSSSLETAKAHSLNSTDKFAKDEMKNIGLEMNENLAVEDVEHNSTFSLHDDINVTCEVSLSPKEVGNEFHKETHPEKSHRKEDQASSLNMQTKEDDIGHKGRVSSAGVYIPVPNIKSSFTSSLTKQGNNGLEDCLDKEVNRPEADLDSSKSKEFESGTNAKLSNLKLSSEKVNTWPLNQQKNVDDQPNCFSDSRNYRVHIQRDAIHCDLETPGNGLTLLKESASIPSSENIHLTEADGMQSCDKRVHDEMICDVSEGTESLLEIQAAEENEIATEVDNDTTEIPDMIKLPEPTCVLNLIKNEADESTSMAAVPENLIINDDVRVTDNNNFEINSPESSQNDDKTMVDFDGIDFDTLEMPSTTIARASILEQICKSASMQTPLSQFSSTFKQHQVEDLYGFMADGILDHMDLETTASIDEDSINHLQTSGTPFSWQSKSHYSSPVGKLWERSASSSGSSELHLSSNPDLTCFPIEEDPGSNEENECPEEMHDELQENISPDVENDDEVAVEIQEPLTESTEVCTQHVDHVSKSSLKYPDRYSSKSVEVSVPRTNDKVKHKPRIHHGIKVSRYEEDNRNSSIATRASSRGNLSVISKNKSSMRSGIPRLSQKEAKRNNIVSNITSFIPLVQQKQAAAVCTGKRDVKVKALEAAEAARRREQEKENERKLKKEALKLERERVGKENAKEIELNLKRKEELKKKEADLAARKRQREEEERKQLAKKRKLVAETQKKQNIKSEKSRGGKLESEKHVKNAAMAGNKKKPENLRQNKKADENSFEKPDTELRIEKTSTSTIQQVTSVPNASNYCGEKDKATCVHEMSPVKVIPVNLTIQERSYDISPYQNSDDDDDYESDDLRTKKFIPSWASKKRVAMALPRQQELDHELIFSIDSFCSMDEVLLPRRLQAQ